MSEAIYERLLGLTRRLCTPTGVDELLSEIAAAGAELLDADRVSVFVHEPAKRGGGGGGDAAGGEAGGGGGGGELWARVADGQRELRVPADRGLVGEALRTRRSIVVPDVTRDPRFNPEVDRATGYRTRTLLTVPMLTAGAGAGTRGQSGGEEGGEGVLKGERGGGSGVGDHEADGGGTRGGEEGGVAGVMQFLNKRCGAFDAADAKWAEVLAAQAAVVLERVLMEDERQARRALEREMAVAREVQEASWPTRLPAVAGYELAGWAEAASAAGGDTYDAVVGADGALWVLIADATGHGVGPALASAQVRSMFRMAVHAGLSVDEAMRYIHRQVIMDMPAGRFVTAFIGRLDPATHTLAYASAGHGPVLLARPGQAAVELETTGLPLGIDFGLDPEPACAATLEPGQSLVLFTDGLFEAMNAAGRTMGIDPVHQVLGEAASAAEQLARLRRVLDQHAAGHAWEDDVTVMVVRRGGRRGRG